ncbi:hypothetical protein [Vibrio diabolicus]|uniref:hypothetical protein n=1 Tax=Vibrio diabolicus TaxID=50719 RepID=UPI003751EBF9
MKQLVFLTLFSFAAMSVLANDESYPNSCLTTDGLYTAFVSKDTIFVRSKFSDIAEEYDIRGIDSKSIAGAVYGGEGIKHHKLVRLIRRDPFSVNPSKRDFLELVNITQGLAITYNYSMKCQ